MNRIICETLLKLDENTLQSESNASRGAGGVEGTCVLVSYGVLEQGARGPTTTGQTWSAFWAQVGTFSTYLDRSLTCTRAKSDEYHSHDRACSKAAMGIKPMITDGHAFHPMVSRTYSRSFSTCSPEVSQLPEYKRHA